MKEKIFTQNTVLRPAYAKGLLLAMIMLVCGILTGFAQAPPAPVAAAATSVTATSFTANWGASTGATTYLFDLSTDASFGTFVTGYNNLNVGNVTSFNITGLSLSTTCYYYRVYAYSVGNLSPVSNVISVGACGTTGVVEDSNVLEMKVYPNPVKDRLFVGVNKTSGVVITISDVLGKEVKRVSVNELIAGADITSLENGIYFVKVRQSESELVERIIINK